MGGLFIKGGTLLDPTRPLSTADVRIEGGTVVEVGRGLAPAGEEVVDADGMIVMPGLVNGHTHSSQSLDRGTAPSMPLDFWLVWVRSTGIELSADDLYTAAAVGALELARTGCTSVVDHATVSLGHLEEHTDAVVQAYIDVGLRAAVAPMAQDLDFFESLPGHWAPDLEPPDDLWGGMEPATLLSHVARFVTRWSGRHARITPMVGPAAPQRCSDEYLAGVAGLAREHGVGIHMHLLETRSQALAVREAHDGGSVLDHLDRLGVVGPRTSFAHGVWLDDDELARLADAGCVLVHNPVSNLRLGSGVLPLRSLVRRGAPAVALGSDGAASNDSLNMFEVLKFASLLQTLYGDFRAWLSPVELWGAALAAGAALFGRRLGAVQPGYDADLVLLRGERHLPATKETLVAGLVYAEHGETVDTTIVDGRVVVREGRPVTVDEASLERRARELRARLVAAEPTRRRAFERAEPFLSRIDGEANRRPFPLRRLLEVA